MVILFHKDKATSTQKEGRRFLWTGIIREDFTEERRFQVGLTDDKNQDHWKCVRGEERGEGTQMHIPERPPGTSLFRKHEGYPAGGNINWFGKESAVPLKVELS